MEEFISLHNISKSFQQGEEKSGNFFQNYIQSKVFLTFLSLFFFGLDAIVKISLLYIFVWTTIGSNHGNWLP